MAAVLDTGDSNWVFVQTNIRYDLRDQSDWKFLDTLKNIENNNVFDKLLVDYGVDSIIFENKALHDVFVNSKALSQYKDYFVLAPIVNNNSF